MNRRTFLKSAGAVTGSPFLFHIVPSTVFGQNAPSNRVTVGMIGTGRQAINVNLKNGFLTLPNCQVVAVNDVDSWRMAQAEKIVNDAYSKGDPGYKGVKAYADYREIGRAHV